MAILIPKYKGYQDANTKITFCKDIDDLAPYHITLTEPPKLDQMVNFGMDFKEQFFKPIVAPKELWELEKFIKSEKDKSLAYKHVEAKDHLANFIAETHDLLDTGQWQLIRGVPTYISGAYLEYLSFYHMDTGLPQFRSWDLEEDYWWEFEIVPNPVCYGGIMMMRRRVGKSFKLGAKMIRKARMNANRYAAMQSKTEDDAERFMKKCITLPFKKYPFYLRPNSSTDLSSKGKRREFDIGDHLGNPALDSHIEYGSSNALAFDGQKEHMYGNDECGKNTEENIGTTLDVIKPCLMEDERIVGKALFTTTVEEMEKRGGANFRQVFLDSDRIIYHDKSKQRITEEGKTVSGLYPYFTPSYANYIADQYGQAIIDEPKEYQYEYMKKRHEANRLKFADKEARKGGRQLIDELINNQKTDAKKQDIIRKFPRSIKEAFRSSAVGCLYDVTKINNRLDYFIRGNDHLVTYGKFGWVDDVKFGTVEFIPTSKAEARVEISLLAQQYANKSVESYGGRAPANTHLFTAGADCFKYDNVKDVARSSKGAGFVYAGFNPAIDNLMDDPSTWKTDDFVCQYFFRYENMPTDEFAEDMLMMCIYYGCAMAPENNLRVVQDYFVKKGFTNYLMFPEKLVIKKGDVRIEATPHAGFYTGGDESKVPMINAMQKYVSRCAQRCKFPKLLEQLRDMDYEDFRPWDLFIAATGAYRHYYQVLERNEKKEDAKIDLGDFFTRYK